MQSIASPALPTTTNRHPKGRTPRESQDLHAGASRRGLRRGYHVGGADDAQLLDARSFDCDAFGDYVAAAVARVDDDVHAVWAIAELVHKTVRDLDGNIEVLEGIGPTLGPYKLKDVRMFEAHHSHISPAPMGSLLDRVCRLSYYFPEANRPGSYAAT